MRSFTVSFSSSKIRFNCVAPGPVNGKITNDWSRERKEELCHRIPRGAFAEPDEIANIILFLLLEESASISGAVIAADGGLGCKFS